MKMKKFKMKQIKSCVNFLIVRNMWYSELDMYLHINVFSLNQKKKKIYRYTLIAIFINFIFAINISFF
jgi:hypothetical protein